MMWQVGQALEYMHSKGLAHNDVKPDNILYCGEEGYKLSDFEYAHYQYEGSEYLDYL